MNYPSQSLRWLSLLLLAILGSWVVLASPRCRPEVRRNDPPSTVAEASTRPSATGVAAAGEMTATVSGALYRVQTDPSPPTAIRLEGPATARTGQLVRLSLTGTPAVDVTKPLAEQISWASAMQMKLLSAQEGATLDGSLVVVFPLSLQLRIEFTAVQPGDYWVVVDWNHESPQLLVHRITVLGDKPQPDPTPGPTPNPTPNPAPGPRYVVIIEESSQRTPQSAAVIKAAGLRTWAVEQGHVIRVVDKDAVVPDDLKPYVALAAGQSLPRIIVATMQGQILVNEDLPPTVDAVKQKITSK